MPNSDQIRNGFISPTPKQWRYAISISCALEDNADLQAMDKWAMRDYISRCLNSKENRDKIKSYTIRMMRYNYETRRNESEKHKKPWLSDESLGGEWGLDASDFGAQSWGDS